MEIESGCSGDMDFPVFMTRSYIDETAFGAKTWDEYCEIVARFLGRMTEFVIWLSLPNIQFGQDIMDPLPPYIMAGDNSGKPKYLPRLSQLQFTTSKEGSQSILGTLYYDNKFINDCSAQAAIFDEFSDGAFAYVDKVA